MKTDTWREFFIADRRTRWRAYLLSVVLGTFIGCASSADEHDAAMVAGRVTCGVFLMLAQYYSDVEKRNRCVVPKP